jgi:hypothetical protein
MRKVFIHSYLRHVKGRKRRQRVKEHYRRKPRKIKRNIFIRSYLRKVKGRKKRQRVKEHYRLPRAPRKPRLRGKRGRKKKSPLITAKDIQHWIHQKDFKRKAIKRLIDAHRGENAFYKALEDYYNRTV